MSKKSHFRGGLRVMAVWLFALATIAAAPVFTAQPARAAAEELIILSLADSDGAIRDAVAATAKSDKEKTGKEVSIVFTDGGEDVRTFYAGPAYPDPLDSDCAGVDLSQAQWNGKMAYIIAGDKTFMRIVYRMGADFDFTKEIKGIFASTVQHGYFRKITPSDGVEAPNGTLVRATGDETPPASTDYTLCVVWVKL